MTYNLFLLLSDTTVPDRMLTEGAARKSATQVPLNPVRVCPESRPLDHTVQFSANSSQVRLHLLPSRPLIRLPALPSYLTARKTPPT